MFYVCYKDGNETGPDLTLIVVVLSYDVFAEVEKAGTQGARFKWSYLPVRATFHLHCK